MTSAPDQLTWDMDVPRRPSLEDLGGATLENDTRFPPDKRRMPYAEQLNQWAKQLERLALLAPVADFEVQFSGGVPVLSSFRANRTNLVLADLTITHVGTGIVEITWAKTDGLGNPIQVFPAPRRSPQAHLAEDVAACAPFAANITGGVSVKMRDQTGALADIGFIVEVF